MTAVISRMRPLAGLAFLALVMAGCADTSLDSPVRLEPVNPEAYDEPGSSAIRQEPVSVTPREATNMDAGQVGPVGIESSRSDGSGGRVVEYALASDNAVGNPIYSRSGTASAGEQACAQLGSDYIAQDRFLRMGGPETDRGNLDPDGDGYACDWTPASFRNAMQ